MVLAFITNIVNKMSHGFITHVITTMAQGFIKTY